MDRAVVADTGPLIALALVGLLPSLADMFAEIYAPDAVVKEALLEPSKPGGREIQNALDRGWIIQRTVIITRGYQELAELLDQGEAEALSLTAELNAIALIDERRGRNVAAARGIPVTGTAAVLLRAKHSGLVPELRPLIRRLSVHGYRMSDRLVAEILHRAGKN